MSDYSEQLISMAGGDGETVDQLAEIEARHRSAQGVQDRYGAIWSYQSNPAHDDRRTLLSIVRSQQAQIERVLDLANTRSRCGWQISADEIRKALKP